MGHYRCSPPTCTFLPTRNNKSQRESLIKIEKKKLEKNTIETSLRESNGNDCVVPATYRLPCMRCALSLGSFGAYLEPVTSVYRVASSSHEPIMLAEFAQVRWHSLVIRTSNFWLKRRGHKLWLLECKNDTVHQLATGKNNMRRLQVHLVDGAIETIVKRR